MNNMLLFMTFIGLISLILLTIGLFFEHNQIVGICGYSFLISLIGTFSIIFYELKRYPFKQR